MIKFLFVILINGQNDKQLQAKEDTAKILRQIKQQYQSFNADTVKYYLREQDLMAESTEGGFVTQFDNGKGTSKLTVAFYGETGKNIIEYYFKNNSLFFVFSKAYHYDKPMYMPHSKTAAITEERYYVDNQKLIKWLKGTSSQNKNTQAFKKEATNLLAESKRLHFYISNCKSVTKNIVSSDTIRCKYGSDCPSTGYILKGSRNVCGEAIHVSPKNKKAALEQ